MENKPLQLKTIAKICKGKIQGWANQVAKDGDEKIAEIIRTKTMITGGAICSLLSGEEVNDYDVYFRDKESALSVARYYCNKFLEQNSDWVNGKISEFSVEDENDRIRLYIKSAGVAAQQEIEQKIENDFVNLVSPTEYQYFETTNNEEASEFVDNLVSHAAKKNKNYSPIFMSDNAITLSNDIQIIIRFFGEPEEIHKNYDFVHCTNVYCSWDNTVHINMEAMESLRTKNLKYVGSLYPICSILRLRKFIGRGWKINAGQVLKIIWQIKDLDLNDVEVLKEQLVGVDAAYFAEMLTILRDDVKLGKTIDQIYITNLLDKIFE